MMKKAFIRFLALLLAVLPLNGCGEKAPAPAIPEEGWYQETGLSLPEETGTIMDFSRLNDGTFTLLSNAGRASSYGPWQVWQSKNGESWSALPVPLPAGQEKGFALIAARFLPDGALALISLESFETTEEEQVMDITYRYTLLSRKGEEQQSAVFSRHCSQPVKSLRLTESGDLLLEEADKLFLLDGGTLEEKRQFGAGDSQLCDYACRGDTLYLTADDAIQSYSLSSGEMTGSFETRETIRSFYAFGAMNSRASERLILPAEDRDSLYYCDQNGIWAHTDGGGLTEEIMDSSGSSLSLPTRKPRSFCALPDGFCILFEEGEGYHLSSFRYTEGTRPNNGELKVYCMNNFRDGRLRQAISLYELDTGVQVDYRIGQPADSEGRLTISYSDAMRTLVTELMAGNGPDVLIFEGMPPSVLIQKGVLLNLSALAAPHLEKGEWLPDISDGFRRPDGSLYGISASFSLPALFGKSETLREVSDFDSFVRWIERLAAESPELRPTEDLSPEYLFTFFYPLCHSAWEGDGDAREPISHFLSNIERIQQLHIPSIPIRNDLDIAAWHEGHIALALGSLRSVSQLANMASLLHAGGREGELKLMTGFEEGCFLPGSVLTVNANGRTEQAQKFIETVLDARCQQYEYYDGMPVNRLVLEQQLSEADSQHREVGYVIEGLDDIRLHVENAWPDEAFAARFWEMVAAAKHPARMDNEEFNAFIDTFFPCFYGGESIEEALGAYLDRLSLQALE